MSLNEIFKTPQYENFFKHKISDQFTREEIEENFRIAAAKILPKAKQEIERLLNEQK